VPSGVPGEAAVLSVPDQYVARAGAFIGVPPVPGLAVGLGARLEGVRHIDLIGDSDGFRRAGYTFGVEPAAQLAVGDWAFSAGVPIAVLRRSYGDASFADYALLFGLTYRFGGHGHPPPAPPMTAHEPARSIADAELVTLDGRPTRLGEALAGRRLTIVNVWAGWCAPCREEMPMLKRLRPEIEARGGALVGVSVDDDADGARAFVAAMGIDFPSYHGGRALSEAIAEPTVPTTLFVDASGRVVFRVRGLLSEAALRSALDEHLGPPRPL
jgi:thiol-disulfide isomerase/thioredoxin